MVFKYTHEAADKVMQDILSITQVEKQAMSQELYKIHSSNIHKTDMNCQVALLTNVKR